MMTRSMLRLAVLAVLTAAWMTAADTPTPAVWRTEAPGFEVAKLTAPVPSSIGDSKVVVIRLDPVRYEPRLLSAKLLGLERNPTAKEWVERYGLVAAINASMYREDHKTSVAYMRDGDRVNNGRWTKDNAVFAASPLDAAQPAVRILDRSCEDVPSLSAGYRTLVQNIRMLDCAGRNTWAKQERRWSTACVGTDGA